MKNKKEQIADLLIWALLVSSVIEESTLDKFRLYVSAWGCLSEDPDTQLLRVTHSVIGKHFADLMVKHSAAAYKPSAPNSSMTEDEVLRTLQDMLETS